MHGFEGIIPFFLFFLIFLCISAFLVSFAIHLSLFYKDCFIPLKATENLQTENPSTLPKIQKSPPSTHPPKKRGKLPKEYKNCNFGVILGIFLQFVPFFGPWVGGGDLCISLVILGGFSVWRCFGPCKEKKRSQLF